MKYSHNYSKLNDDYYTTIRRYNKGYKIGDIITEIYPNGKHKAKITNIVRNTLNNLFLWFLIDDTDLMSRNEIYNLFQSFYKKPIDFKNEQFYIYYLEKLE